MNNVADIKAYLLKLQNHICHTLTALDGQQQFRRDEWTRVEGGGGITCVLENGAAFEKAGVNFSHVFGEGLPPSATAHRPELAGCCFEALGVSLVLHPRNPFVPITHANFRYFEAKKDDEAPIWWFGGGFDLTPCYGFEEDCIHWHQTALKACEPFGEQVYPRFKKWCDEYFYLKHRQEARGIGGLFFDDLNEWPFETAFAFMRSVGDHFLDAYVPIFQARVNHPYDHAHKDFQLYRRGRYAEFNLIYDRGTLFGLQSGGRVESILMSLPPMTCWIYDRQPQNIQEVELVERYLKPQEWVYT